jgi:hypothetical protein
MSESLPQHVLVERGSGEIEAMMLTGSTRWVNEVDSNGDPIRIKAPEYQGSTPEGFDESGAPLYPIRALKPFELSDSYQAGLAEKLSARQKQAVSGLGSAGVSGVEGKNWWEATAADTRESGPFSDSEKAQISSLSKYVRENDSEMIEVIQKRIDKLFKDGQISRRALVAATVISAAGFPTNRINDQREQKAVVARLTNLEGLKPNQKESLGSYIEYVRGYRHQGYADKSIEETLRPHIEQEVNGLAREDEDYRVGLLSVLAAAGKCLSESQGEAELNHYLKYGDHKRITVIKPY